MLIPLFVPHLVPRTHQRMLQIARRLICLVECNLSLPEDDQIPPSEIRRKLWLLIWLAYTVGKTGTCPTDELLQIPIE